MLIDLHLHSHFSDGELSPDEIMEKATEKGLNLISITDHNTLIPYIDAIKQTAKNLHLNFIEGTEISCVKRSSGLSLHILGYSNTFDREKICDLISGTINGYNLRAKKICDKLNREFSGIDLDFDKIKDRSTEAYISRNTLARLLLEFTGNYMSMEEALKRHVFIQEDDSWMLSAKDAISGTYAAGGLPVLAHSGRILEKIGQVQYEMMIDELISFGLLGLEVSHPKISYESESAMRQVAKDRKLFITAGSDWHGPNNTPNIDIGRELSQDDIGLFLQRLEP